MFGRPTNVARLGVTISVATFGNKAQSGLKAD